MEIYTYVSPVIGVLAIVTNIIQSMAIIKTKTKKEFSNSTVFILNLSLSDGFVGFVVVSVKIMHAIAINSRGKLFGNKEFRLAFQMSQFMFFRMSLVLSMLNLVAITVDRLLCVVQPFKYRTRLRKIYVFVCVSLWLIACILALSLWLLIRDNRDLVWVDTLLFPVITIPSSLLLLSSYAFIWFTLRNRNAKFSLSTREGTNDLPNITSSASTTTPSPNIKRVRVFQEQKMLRLMIAMVSAFVVCWMPLAIYLILLVTGDGMNNTMSSWFYVLAISNSVINPLIYFQFIRAKLRKKFSYVFKTLKRGKSEKISLSINECVLQSKAI